MHALLQPAVLIRLASFCVILGCLTLIATALLQRPAPIATAIAHPEPPPIVRTVQTIRIQWPHTFEQRWQLPQAASEPKTIGQAPQAEQPRVKRDPVCGSKGRRTFKIGRRLSWKCRR